MTSGTLDSRVFRVMFVSEDMRRIFSDEIRCKSGWTPRLR